MTGREERDASEKRVVGEDERQPLMARLATGKGGNAREMETIRRKHNRK